MIIIVIIFTINFAGSQASSHNSGREIHNVHRAREFKIRIADVSYNLLAYHLLRDQYLNG